MSKSTITRIPSVSQSTLSPVIWGTTADEGVMRQHNRTTTADSKPPVKVSRFMAFTLAADWQFWSIMWSLVSRVLLIDWSIDRDLQLTWQDEKKGDSDDDETVRVSWVPVAGKEYHVTYESVSYWPVCGGGVTDWFIAVIDWLEWKLSWRSFLMMIKNVLRAHFRTHLRTHSFNSHAVTHSTVHSLNHTISQSSSPVSVFLISLQTVYSIILIAFNCNHPTRPMRRDPPVARARCDKNKTFFKNLKVFYARTQHALKWNCHTFQDPLISWLTWWLTDRTEDLTEEEFNLFLSLFIVLLDSHAH